MAATVVGSVIGAVIAGLLTSRLVHDAPVDIALGAIPVTAICIALLARVAPSRQTTSAVSAP